LKNYETCPKRHYHVDVLKQFKDESEALLQGNLQHKLLAEAIGYGKSIPDAYKETLEPWTKRIFDWKGVDVRERGAVFKVEEEYAITSAFEPCEWFANGTPRFNGVAAWFRAKADAVWTLGPLGAVFDWKTGKIVEDSVQLLLTAAVMFAHHPQLQIVRSQFVWLAHDTDTRLDIKRSELPQYWAALWPRITALTEAHKNTEFPPTPSYLCRKFCPVTTCPHHGESHGR
jgi:hypothetical protein